MPAFNFIRLNTLSHKTVLYKFAHKVDIVLAGCILIKLNMGVNVCSYFIIHTGSVLKEKIVVQVIATIAVTLVFNTTTEKHPELFLKCISMNSE